MKAKNALLLFLGLVILSTVIGLVAAFGYWEGVYPTDLRSGKKFVALVLIEFKGQEEPCQEDWARVLEELLPHALDELAKHSEGLTREKGQGMTLQGLVVSWTEEECVLEYADGKIYSSSGFGLPNVREWKERGQGLRLVGVQCAFTFSDIEILSAVISFQLSTWSSESVHPEPLDVRNFWTGGKVASHLEIGGYLRRLEVRLEPPVSSTQGITAFKLPDILYTLARCIRGHLEVFSENELEAALNALKEDEILYIIALGIERQCKIGGHLIEDCGARHMAYVNNHVLDFIKEGSRTVSLGPAQHCYTIFGP